MPNRNRIRLSIFDAYPDPEQTFPFFYADPDPDPDPAPSFTYFGKYELLKFIHSIANFRCFIFRISVIDFIIFSSLESLLSFSGKKYSLFTFD
jgi:hypothetical protein